MAFDFQQYNDLYVQNVQAGGAPINDAKEYEVRIVPAENVAEGEIYWRIIGVHHLLPLENFGIHHAYLEALDEEGHRLGNPHAWAGWTWENRGPDERADPVPLDKPDYETAGNIAIYFGQVVSVWVKGLGRDDNDKTDTAENIHTLHPDEPLPDGSLHNTIGHHSFYVVFQRSRQGPPPADDGVISGAVVRGEGYTVQLQRDGKAVDEQQLNQTEAFEFDDLLYGTYQVEVLGPGIREEDIVLDAGNRVAHLKLEVPQPPGNSEIFGIVKNGAGRALVLIQAESVLESLVIPASTEYRFSELSAGTYLLHVIETTVRQDNIILDGSNIREINLKVPEIDEPEKFIPHYLLFGPPAGRGRKVNIQLAADFILAFSVTAGFSVSQAQRAHQVTIIGEGINESEKNAIIQSGSELEELAGDACEIEEELQARIEAGNSFPEG